MGPLPESIQQFIASRVTRPATSFWEGPHEPELSRYGRYWYRAVGCMLLSGRVRARADGTPNRTDVNRFCKEANFNQFWFESIARFLVAAEVVQVAGREGYKEGPHHARFWSHEAANLPSIARQGVLALLQARADSHARLATAGYSHLVDFLALFFACFKDMALPEKQIGQAFLDFCGLPEKDLNAAGKGIRDEGDVHSRSVWKPWLDQKGQAALLSALYTADWVYYAEVDRVGWVFPSPLGLGMLGLAPVPQAPPLATDLKALPNNCVFAGAGLAMDRLVPLFRCCTVKRIDEVFEFQLDRKRLAETPSKTSPAEELRRVLEPLGPLPSTIESLLGTKSRLGGVVRIRWCSALLKPENDEVLTAIREHPKLKGYLEPGAPPGYLLIKSSSSPDGFIRRCEALGFEVNSL